MHYIHVEAHFHLQEILYGSVSWRYRFVVSHQITGGNEAEKPSVDHLIAFLQPAKAGHSSVGCGSIQVHDHVVLCNHQLQCADHVTKERHAES